MKKIIVAGIYRSGSTWQFNAIRMILKWGGKKFNQHNIYHPELSITDPDAEYEIYKLHEYIPNYAENADYVFTSFRNPEEILKSYHRCFDIQVDGAWLAKANENYCKWKSISKYDMDYSLLLTNKREIIINLSTILGIEINADEILKELDSLVPPAEGYDPITCYFQNHIQPAKNKFKIYYRQHVWFAAKNLKRNLEILGHEAEFVTWVNPADITTYIIYCAFAIEKLPSNYIVY